MPNRRKTICTQCRWIQLELKCGHPDFDLIRYVDGYRDLPDCYTVNQHGDCGRFKAAGRLRRLFRQQMFAIAVFCAAAVATVLGLLEMSTEGRETSRAVDGWGAAFEIADWLPGQLRTKAIEQIERQRRNYH